MKYVLAYGTVTDGHVFVGPFLSYEMAKAYLDQERHRENIELIALDAPAWVGGSIRDLDLPTRAINALLNGVPFMRGEMRSYDSIDTISKLITFSEKELLAIPNCGKRTVGEIVMALAKRNLTLAKDEQ